MNDRSLIERAVSKLPNSAVAEPRTSSAYRVNGKQDQSRHRSANTIEFAKTSATIDRTRLNENNIISPNARRSRTVEEFRLIKRALLMRYAINTDELQNVVLVTSALEGEGKTFNALNLAMSIALEKDYRVLLVDADMTNPTVMRTLGIRSEKGLIDVLSNDQLSLSDVMIKTDIDGLSVLPPGTPHALSTELLASKKMTNLVTELARRYQDRFIIFDTPPVLVTSETTVLAQHVGQVVFVVKSDKTSRETVKEALGLIGDCKNISLVLNGTSDLFGKTQFGAHYERYQRKNTSTT